MQSLMAFLQAVIYAISACLLYPVMIGLVALTAWSIVYTGRIFAEWIARLRQRQQPALTERLTEICQQKMATQPQKVSSAFMVYALSVPARRYLSQLIALTAVKDSFYEQKIEALIQECEYDLTRSIDRIRLVVRIGPALGLMGTLIPMSTGLAALAQGNMSQVSSSLIIAFTTTVVGLVIGIAAQIFAVAKTRWVQEDIRNIELITEVLTREHAS